MYLCAYDSVAEARASLGRYLAFYNARRPHSSLDARTPDDAYFNPPAVGSGMSFGACLGASLNQNCLAMMHPRHGVIQSRRDRRNGT